MTDRLTAEDVEAISRNLPGYDAELLRKTGLSLRRLAARAAGVGDAEAAAAVESCKAAVVRVTSGQGIIPGFAEAVHAILVYLGAAAFIPAAADVAGLAEAAGGGADVLFMADDHRFVALCLRTSALVDNAEATGKGYVAALEAMAGGLDGRGVLVIGGAGRVGWSAVLALEKRGAQPSVHDPDRSRLESLSAGHKVEAEHDLASALARFPLVFDASPASDIIQSKHIRPETCVAAPGIPPGLTEEAYAVAGDRVIHDVLEIGVATMLVEACCRAGMYERGVDRIMDRADSNPV